MSGSRCRRERWSGTPRPERSLAISSRTGRSWSSLWAVAVAAAMPGSPPRPTVCRARPKRVLPGEHLDLDLELKLLADVGLVGLPNAGKSTLLSRLSAARPKVADYPFTTLEPHLGVVAAPDDDFQTLVMADIPGIIEGAHTGSGLGTQFLRHVERCPVLAHLVDLSSEDSIEERVDTIRSELEAHEAPLETRPWILVGTKLDAVAEREAAVADLAAVAEGFDVAWQADFGRYR